MTLERLPVTDKITVPWVPEVFLTCGWNFRCGPMADTSSAVGRSHERQSREKTLNRARKVSGTQGKITASCQTKYVSQALRNFEKLLG